MLNKKEMGQKISALRKEANLSQTELGQKIGYQQADISRIEKGTKDLTFSALVDIAQLFNVSADYLLGLATDFTTDDELKFVCKYTGLSAEAIKNLKTNTLYTDLCSNEMICLNAIKESDIYSKCRNDLLQSDAINQIISSMVYEKILYKSLLELKKKADLDELRDDKDTHNLTLKALKWKHQHKIHLFNAQDSLMNFIKEYTEIETLDVNLYNTIVNIATTYTIFEDKQKARDELENKYFNVYEDELNGNDN